MNIVEILSAIKGKVLDVAHFELLKSAYELQSQNIEQLKENNNALKESNVLLKSKAEGLTKENGELKSRLAELEGRLAAIKPDAGTRELSEVASAVLAQCVKDDIIDFYSKRMVDVVPFSKLQVEAAIDELKEREFISLGSYDNNGAHYFLKPGGKKYVLQMAKK